MKQLLVYNRCIEKKLWYISLLVEKWNNTSYIFLIHVYEIATPDRNMCTCVDITVEAYQCLMAKKSHLRSRY